MRHLKIYIILSILFLFIISLVLILKTGQSKNSAPLSPLKSDRIPHQRTEESGTEVLIDKKYLLGKFDPAQEDDFVEVSIKHASRQGLYLRKKTYAAFIRMDDAARQAGVNLIIVSATRNFDSQRSIWNRKWSGKTRVEGKNLALTISDPLERARVILKFSSMPGTSRHHWGTDIDLNALENDYFEAGEGKRVYDWLQENASFYGFCQTYTPKNSSRPSGYEEEKWHWSHIPLARSFLDQYMRYVRYDDLKGFLGWETAHVLKVIENYVQSIDTNCK